MKKIGFICVYDKTDLILGIAKILVEAQKKVLVIDATEIQKSRYVVPVINPTKSYITEFEGIDVAVGFETLENVKQYLAIDGEDKFDYDYMLIDTDDYKGIVGFNLPDAEKLYYITSFDAYSLKKGIEVLGQIEMPLHMMKLFFSKEMLKEASSSCTTYLLASAFSLSISGSRVSAKRQVMGCSSPRICLVNSGLMGAGVLP